IAAGVTLSSPEAPATPRRATASKARRAVSGGSWAIEGSLSGARRARRLHSLADDGQPLALEARDGEVVLARRAHLAAVGDGAGSIRRACPEQRLVAVAGGHDHQPEVGQRGVEPERRRLQAAVRG